MTLDEKLQALRRCARFELDDARDAPDKQTRALAKDRAARVARAMRYFGQGRRAWNDAAHDVVAELREIDSGERAGVFP